MRAWISVIAFAILPSCNRPPTDCGDYEESLRAISAPQALTAEATSVLRREKDWVVASFGEQRVSALAEGTLAVQSEVGAASPLALLGADKTALLLDRAELKPFDVSLKLGVAISTGTPEWLISTSESHVSFVSGPLSSRTLMSYQVGGQPTALFEDRGEFAFAAVSRNESATCALGFEADGQTRVLRCHDSDGTFTVAPAEPVAHSSLERHTLAMTATSLFWLAQSGALYSMNLRTRMHSVEERIRGRIAWLQGGECGVLVLHVESDSPKLTYLGNSVIDLTTGSASRIRLSAHHLAYIIDNRAFFHTF